MPLMDLSDNDIKHLAHLSRLRVDENDTERFRAQVSSILAYVSELTAVDTEGVDPTGRGVETTNVLRDDVVDQSPLGDALLENASEKHDKLIKVRSVFENE